MERVKEIWERNENGDLVLVRTEVLPNYQDEIDRRLAVIAGLQQEIEMFTQKLQEEQQNS
jgi:hypothetical protein